MSLQNNVSGISLIRPSSTTHNIWIMPPVTRGIHGVWTRIWGSSATAQIEAVGRSKRESLGRILESSTANRTLRSIPVAGPFQAASTIIFRSLRGARDLVKNALTSHLLTPILHIYSTPPSCQKQAGRLRSPMPAAEKTRLAFSSAQDLRV